MVKSDLAIVWVLFYVLLAYSAYISGIYKVALTHKKLGITKELLATKVVPFLFPLCIDNGLNLTQVSSVNSTP